ncbi:MAG TPA: hypothetical protein ENH20_00335, partial [Candidatus Pacearchaeota archaeon]|nr:hypothetical protein [Candidatus Pacearchaeota archaeon]
MKNLSILLVAILILTSVSALEINPEYESNIIVKDFQNSIQLDLEITNATPGTYNLYTLADITIKPSETFQITENTTQKQFTITPTENLDIEGNYAFTYVLNHRGVEKIEQKMLLNIVNLEDIIEISSESIQPDSQNVSFYIQNKEAVHIKNITAKFSSIIFETDDITFDLKPNEKLEIAVDVDETKLKKTKAGVYIIKSIFQTKNGEKEIEGNLYLGEKKGILSTQDKAGILIQSETLTKVNTGNVIESIEIK